MFVQTQPDESGRYLLTQQGDLHILEISVQPNQANRNSYNFSAGESGK